ncbi:TetR/AcrR family transcriptional regulator C-terminal ligand-binding domain-containing protein [Streptomyces sp. NPDC002643]
MVSSARALSSGSMECGAQPEAQDRHFRTRRRDPAQRPGRPRNSRRRRRQVRDGAGLPARSAARLDALANEVRPRLSFDGTPVRAQLVNQLEQLALRLNQPRPVSVLATVIQRADRDEEARRIREESFGRADEDFARAPAVAVERGELRSGVPEHATDLIARIIGPLLFRRFLLGMRLEKDLVANRVDAALAPWLPNT